MNGLNGASRIYGTGLTPPIDKRNKSLELVILSISGCGNPGVTWTMTRKMINNHVDIAASCRKGFYFTNLLNSTRDKAFHEVLNQQPSLPYSLLLPCGNLALCKVSDVTGVGTNNVIENYVLLAKARITWIKLKTSTPIRLKCQIPTCR